MRKIVNNLKLYDKRQVSVLKRLSSARKRIELRFKWILRKNLKILKN